MPARQAWNRLSSFPHGNISYGKLAQALEYGARTLQVEANFDQILALVRVLAERLGIYLLNSINPFRIEGQKTIIFEMMDQRDWNPPDWIVLAWRQSRQHVRIRKSVARVARCRIHQQDPAPGRDSSRRRRAILRVHARRRRISEAMPDPHTLATAIKIGDPVSWPKALQEIDSLKRSSGESKRTGDRRCKGDHWTLWDRMRAGLGGDAGRYQKTD